MTKDDILYSVIGVGGGLVLGFLIGNWSSPAVTAPHAATPRGETAATSVNAPRESELPPGHPQVNPGETVPAPPLPAGSEGGSAGGGSTSAAGGDAVALPSLDPLPASSKEERAEKKYKNIQMLKGLPADRIESIMFAFKNSLGVECTYCHIKDQFEKDDRPAKQTARKMIALTRDANSKLSSARVSCFTCHRGHPRPED